MKSTPKLALVLALVAATLGFAGLLPAQKKGTTKDDEDVLKTEKECPFTKNDPELMKAAGIESFGPFPWADFYTTDDIETVLGEGRFLWVETAHFRIGYSMKTRAWPAQNEKRRFHKAEIKEFRETLPKFPSRPRKFTPWVQLHLFAWRLEKLYTDVQDMLGVTDADFGDAPPTNGKYLGLGDKYLVLMFEKKSDLQRYFRRFCNAEADVSMRWYHKKTHQMVAACAAEGLEGFDVTAIQSHVIYSAAHNLLCGYKGFHLNLPLWLGEGLAHSFTMDIPSDVANVNLLDSEPNPDLKIGAWPVKVRKRARHEGVCFPFDEMARWTDFEAMGYQHHAQSWARVDYLLKRDKQKLGFLVKRIKEIPPVPNAMVPHERIEQVTRKLLVELYELDAATFDEKWREWVLDNYPKK